VAERTPGFFDVDERLAELSAKGDDLERVSNRSRLEGFKLINGEDVACPRGVIRVQC
jgi:hypothetical protein